MLVLSRKIGNRVLMIGAALTMALLVGFGIPYLGPTGSEAPNALAAPLLFAAIGVPIAAFLAIPNAMLAEVCNANVLQTGERGEAMFFGASGFVQKLMIGAAAGAVSWLMEVFGKTVEHPLGVQLTGPIAALALIGAALCFWAYPERSISSARCPEAGLVSAAVGGVDCSTRDA